MTRRFYNRGGFTLVELVAVIAVIAIIAFIAFTKTSRFIASSRRIAAEADLKTIREALIAEEGGYLADMRGIAGFSPSELRLANLLIATNLYGLADSGKIDEFTTGSRVDDTWLGKGVARPEEFVSWNQTSSRGWRGPYVKITTGVFPRREDKLEPYDLSAEDRGFYPQIDNLYLSDYLRAHREISVYGFPGEPAIIDPWGNPYILQIPPPQAFSNETRKVSPEIRWRYARIVSAGENGILETPCFGVNSTNAYSSAWTERTRRMSRQAGLVDGDDFSARGDDLVLFISRNDIDEGEGVARE